MMPIKDKYYSSDKPEDTDQAESVEEFQSRGGSIEKVDDGATGYGYTEEMMKRYAKRGAAQSHKAKGNNNAK